MNSIVLKIKDIVRLTKTSTTHDQSGELEGIREIWHDWSEVHWLN